MGIAGASILNACSNKNQEKTFPKITWRMATSWPKSLEVKFGGAEIVCQRIREMTNGHFDITPYPAGEIVPALEILDAVQKGTVECGHTDSYYYIKKNQALAFGTGVPFGLNTRQQNAWLYEGGGLEAIQEIYAEFNVINFPAGSTGGQMGGWFRRQISSTEELKGLKMRIPGLGGKVMSRLGVEVKVLPGNKIYQELEEGKIDAAEWIGPYDDEKLQLHKVAQFYYYPGWWEPGSSDEVQINKDKWSELPTEYQEILKAACVEANIRTMARYDKLNRSALKNLIKSGTRLTRYSPDILEAARKEAFELYEEMSIVDSDFKKVYKKWKRFREEVYQWHGVAELSFSEFSFIL